MADDKQMNLQNSLADPKPRNPTPQEIDRNILHSLYAFKEGAPLKNYILKKRPSTSEFLTLAEILTILKEIIHDEDMFDMRNPAIFLCDQNLENGSNYASLACHGDQSDSPQSTDATTRQQTRYHSATKLYAATQLFVARLCTATSFDTKRQQ
jgi:hypothetical protein